MSQRSTRSNCAMDDDKKIPKSLEKMLTVTPSSGRTSTLGCVEPSVLLDKLNSFLPKLQEANDALLSEDQHKVNSIPAPQLVQAKESGTADGEDETIAEDSAVNMDMYLDNSLGELVPNADAVKDEENGKTTLIEEVKPNS